MKSEMRRSKMSTFIFIVDFFGLFDIICTSLIDLPCMGKITKEDVMTKVITVPIVRTKNGLPATWETGGAGKNTGQSTIIATDNFNRPTPIYIKTRGSLSNGDHALVVLAVGMHVIKSNQHHEDFNTFIYRVKEIFESEAVLELINCFSENHWDVNPGPIASSAIEAAESKAMRYHCRVPYYCNDVVVRPNVSKPV